MVHCLSLFYYEFNHPVSDRLLSEIEGNFIDETGDIVMNVYGKVEFLIEGEQNPTQGYIIELKGTNQGNFKVLKAR